MKIAPTGSLLFIVIVQLPPDGDEVGWAGLQFADQPMKIEPGSAVAVNVTWLPSTKFPVHPAPDVDVERQSIPAGVLTTLPVPVPTL